MEKTGKSFSTLEHALMNAPAQKRMAAELGISDGELSRQIAAVKKAIPLLAYLGLEISDSRVSDAMRVLLKESL